MRRENLSLALKLELRTTGARDPTALTLQDMGGASMSFKLWVTVWRRLARVTLSADFSEMNSAKENSKWFLQKTPFTTQHERGMSWKDGFIVKCILHFQKARVWYLLWAAS